MVNKRDASLLYYRGVRDAMAEHVRKTEDGLRALTGVEAGDAERLISAVQKRHDKLLQKIDGKIAAEIAREA